MNKDTSAEIAEVLPFIWGIGGLAFSPNRIEGCAIKLVDSGVVSIQSDGEYVDFSYAKGDKKKR